MSYPLKTTEPAASLISCVLVDDDGTTIVDLKGNPVTPHANVTIGQSAWNGVARKFFQTSGTGGYTPYGVSWSAPKPAPTNPIGIFVALAGASATGEINGRGFVFFDGGTTSGLRVSAGKLAFGADLASQAVGSTALPLDDAVKFSVAGNYAALDTGQVFYGVDGSSLADDSGGPQATQNYALGSAINYIGGWPGQGYLSLKCHVVAVFNRKLTLAEYQSLHSDWFGVLIDAGASIALSPDPASVTNGGTTQITITRNTAAPTGGVTYNLASSAPAVATVPATVNMASGQTTATFSVTGVSLGSATITATNAADALETDGVSVLVTAVRKLRVLVEAAAAGATGISGVVFAAPTSGQIAGAEIGEFTGASFGGSLVGGKAELKVDTSAFGGAALTTSDVPAVLVRSASHTTGITQVDVSIIEE